MHQKPLIILAFALLLTGCNFSSSNITPSIHNSVISQASEISTNSQVSAISSTSKIDVSSSPSIIPSVPVSISETSISEISHIASLTSTSAGQLLPIGNTTVSGPSITTVDDITEWKNYELIDSLPANFSYIMGNNKVATCTNFYSATAGGGFKFRNEYAGFQTGYFNTWKKVEMRLHISCVNNNTKTPDKGKPILHIYGYDANGNYVYFDTVEQGAVIPSKSGTEIKKYIKNPNVTYLEIRLNALAYNGSQCYNFGIDQLSLKGWDYE